MARPPELRTIVACFVLILVTITESQVTTTTTTVAAVATTTTTTTTTTTSTTTTTTTTTTTSTTTTTVTTTTTEAPTTLDDGICYCLGATSAGNIGDPSHSQEWREEVIRKVSELRREAHQNFTVRKCLLKFFIEKTLTQIKR